jgi:hypothetical protein
MRGGTGVTMRQDEPDPLLQRVAALERRVCALEDERELRDLLYRYSAGADVHRGAPWVGLFTEDGVYDLGSRNVDGAFSGRFEGPEELLGLITGHGMPPEGRAQHHHGPVRFEVRGDDATAESYSITYRLDDDGEARIYCLGFSRWAFRREDGRWRIAERQRRELGARAEREVILPPDAELAPAAPGEGDHDVEQR